MEVFCLGFLNSIVPEKTYKLQVFDINPAAFMLPAVEISPLRPHLLIALQLGIDVNGFHTMFFGGFKYADHHQRIHALAL